VSGMVEDERLDVQISSSFFLSANTHTRPSQFRQVSLKKMQRIGEMCQ
jgi:hypothetical protein